MPTKPYFLASGKRAPGVTTVINLLGANKPGLMWWANRLAYNPLSELYNLTQRLLAGENVNEQLEKFHSSNPDLEDFDHKKTTRKACDAGTLAHAMVESDITKMITGKRPKVNTKEYTKDVIKLAKQAFANYLAWKKMTGFIPLYTEVYIISELMECGGTPDLIAKINGEIALLDWKTGSSIYADHLCQGAAYISMWNETHPKELITGGYHGLRFDKNTGGFDHKHRTDLSEALEAFKTLRKLYDIMKVIK